MVKKKMEGEKNLVSKKHSPFKTSGLLDLITKDLPLDLTVLKDRASMAPSNV